MGEVESYGAGKRSDGQFGQYDVGFMSFNLDTGVARAAEALAWVG